ncbi:protein farnesyltransferase/geranylgeranyltransferase type-1 subunit alpha [Nematocida sp. AWRm80]|nr:protein farnesyltransferase/geranylgeranyltransferase type-1 subunit alpha [Nematocida sp. AWRm80]
MDPIEVNYPSEYLSLLHEHKANMLKETHSLEELQIINMLLETCCNSYTLWVNRREILPEIIATTEYTLEDELQWLKEVISHELKNYQVWHHLKYLIHQLKLDIVNDRELLQIIKKDHKNIHFWGAFITALDYSDLYQALQYTEAFIIEDQRNNSVFSIRYTILKRILQSNPEYLDKEILFVLKIALLQKNPAYWNYVTGLDEEYPEKSIFKKCLVQLKQKEIPHYHED